VLFHGSNGLAVKNAAIGAGLGAAVGVTAGILLAPKSGKETREDIARNAKKATEAVSENTKKLPKRLWIQLEQP